MTPRMGAKSRQQIPELLVGPALAYRIAQVRVLKTEGKFSGFAQPELSHDIVPHLPGRAGREGGNWLVRE